MHETYIHTVLSLRQKTPSLLFMLRKQKDPYFVKKDIHSSQREIPSCDRADETVFPEAYFVP
jgi:hypothetical protein